MRNLVLMICVLVPFTLALAQETPEADVFGGYSYLRSGGNFNGWNASVTVNANDWIGLTGDISGHYTSQNVTLAGLPPLGSSANLHTFAFGPTVSYRGNDRFTPFGHFLFGFSHISEKVSLVDVQRSASDTGAALVIGGGFDIPASDHWSFRPQADYLGSHFNGWLNSFRLSVGLAYRWGSR